MPRKLKEASIKQTDLIRECSHKGYSANRIQKELQKRNMGMKRQRLLTYVREYKGKRLKAESSKYTPTKYKGGGFVTYEPHRHQIAIYGSKGGQSRRAELSGGANELYRSMILGLWKHPPKKEYKILRIHAEVLNANPHKYLAYDEEWDKHPEVNSL